MKENDFQEDIQALDASGNGVGHSGEYEDVLQEIERQESGKSSWLKNLLILIITILVFFRLGSSEYGLKNVLMVIGVILIHEIGHFVGMRLFGYRNVKMFFIPLVGAAVSGKGRNVAPWKKAVVDLLGPVPGILVGIALGAIHLRAGTPILLELGMMFVFINGFNLLPFMPLDGGRFLRDILFARNRYVEVCFGLLGAAGLLAAAYYLQAWLLGLIGVLSLIGCYNSFRLSKVAQEMRDSCAATATGESGEAPITMAYSESIPAEKGRQIIKRIYERMGAELKPHAVARMSRDVWERIYARPPRTVAALGLLASYLAVIGVMVGSFWAIRSELRAAQLGETQTKIVICAKADGSKEWKQRTYLGDRLILERDLSPWAIFFQGREVGYHVNGRISWEGNWDSGHRNGTWNAYDTRGKLIRVMVFERGKFITWKELKGSRWVEKGFEELPEEEREQFRSEVGQLYMGPEAGTKWENESPR